MENTGSNKNIAVVNNNTCSDNKNSTLGNKNTSADNKKVKFIVCDVVHDEVKDRMPSNWDVVIFEKKLHEKSDHLREVLQKEIDNSQEYDSIILGYGLCGKSVDGLSSPNTYMIIPKCDDCISLFLGSTAEYKKQIAKAPGSYYLTRGYIGENENLMLANYEEMKAKYSEETLKWVVKEMLKNYTRMVYINTGNYEPGEWRKIAQQEAEKLDLAFEEINGTDEFFTKLVSSNWDDDFLVIKPGEIVKLDMFIGK
ncbi:MAG TPA: DUF1638 domain-containing protein [Candidatus Humimicrobiaceae bacterium]